ncbi:hypothetical protein [Mycolicibacter icosiumassiliensis]|uniref:hypothetical protein n=1 Tax=Mycolicibacter icosiumassiliensis TaxID=1792835 RepID=UPI001430DCAA|nr:hypothetical protein [Mycolicibacter icosiumassiliensis]
MTSHQGGEQQGRAQIMGDLQRVASLSVLALGLGVGAALATTPGVAVAGTLPATATPARWALPLRWPLRQSPGSGRQAR